MFVLKVLSMTLAIATPYTALAQTEEGSASRPLRGKHAIEVNMGFLSEMSVANEVSVGGVATTSEADGFIGSLGYSYWFADEWAVNLSIGVAGADASTSVSGAGVSVESATVVPMLFGVKYEPLALAVGDALRPYLSASLGPYFGFASDVRTEPTMGTESYAETALGSRAAAGMDLYLSRRFTLGLNVGYRLVSDFGRRIGSETNYSSPEVSLSLGLLIGRGKQ